MAEPRFTPLGKLLSVLLVGGLIGLGAYMLWSATRAPESSPAGEGAAASGDTAAPEVSEVQVEVPKLSPPAAVQITDNTIPIEISEYAGYAGLIAANGGLEPNEKSRIRFIHLNHTNPALQPGSSARRAIEAAGFHVAEEGERVGL